MKFRTKLLFVMKLTTALILIASLHVFARTAGQTVSYTARNAKLEDVFTALKKQTGYGFFYQVSDLKNAKPVNAELKNLSLADALTQILKDQRLSFEIAAKTVFITAKKNSAAVPQDLNLQLNAFHETASPTHDISGRVTDANGNPLAGASVKVKETTQGTTTGPDGVFVLRNIDERASLEISFIGYQTIIVAVGTRTSVTAILKAKEESLQEVVVNKGYYTEREKLSVGDVGQVTAKTIEKQPVNNPLLALQGRVTGLFINQTNGLPGSGVTVQIQGQNSMVFGTDPLYVVDGVPYPAQRLSTNMSGILGVSGTQTFANSQSGNPLSAINPNDIESIEILKDADATSIYGSRAANGAILITTKKAKAGKMRIDANVQAGWGKMIRRVNMLNTQQYLAMRREGLANDGKTVSATDYDINGTWDTTRYTNWQDKFLGGTSKYNDLQLSLSGGTNTTQYLISGDFHRETTVFPGDYAYKKGAVHIQLNSATADQKLRIQFSGNYVSDDNLLPYNDFTSYAVFNAMAPDAPSLTNPDGSINWAPNSTTGQSTWPSFSSNPLVYNQETVRIRSSNLVSNAILSYQVLPSLELKVSAGYNKLDSREFFKIPLVAVDPYVAAIVGNDLRQAYFTNSTIATWLLEPQLRYRRKLFKGDFEVLMGSSIQQQDNNGQNLNGVTYVSDVLLSDIRSAGTVTAVSSVSTYYKYNAFFGRLNYNYADKFILNVTGRRDGSSRFGPENQFHNFGSVGAAWIFSNETFASKHLPFLSFGKLRASYGSTGNDQIPDYQYLSLYPTSPVSVPYQGINGLMVNRLTNPYIQWEETRKMQAGVELRFLNDRINLNVNYYRNRSSNQLLQYSLPYVAGFSSIYQNLPALIQNTGWEISIGQSLLRNKPFQWTSNFTLTIPRNELVSFPNIQLTSYASYLNTGGPFTLGPVYQYLGVNPTTGWYQFADANGLPVTTTGSSVAAKINLAPKLYGGFQNIFSYKGFELDIFFQFSNQTGANYQLGDLPGQSFTNQPVWVLNRWQKSGDNASLQRFYGGNSTTNSVNRTARTSDFAYSDASYIRLKNASLSWRLPQAWLKKMSLQTCKFYLSGQNLATISNYVGLDPETRSQVSLPPLRTITAGVQLGL